MKSVFDLQIWPLILVIILFSNGAFAMGLSDAGKVCLFSGMSGVIKIDGKPVAGARLVRSVKKENKARDEVVTDDNGYFELKPIFERSLTKYLPMEFVVSQQIDVYYKGAKYEMWSGVKREPDENTESRGESLIVECELASEERLKIVNGSAIFSLCKWDADPDPKEENVFF